MTAPDRERGVPNHLGLVVQHYRAPLVTLSDARPHVCAVRAWTSTDLRWPVDDGFRALPGSLVVDNRRVDAGILMIARSPRLDRQVGDGGHNERRKGSRLSRKQTE